MFCKLLRRSKLGSISSLRCHKSRNASLKDLRCEVMFSRTECQMATKRRLPVFAFWASPGHASFYLAWPLSGVAAPPAAEGEAWWSQTGSNRRPHACKARALPAELWPRTRRRNALSRIVVLASAGATAQQPSFKTGLPSRSCQSSEGWWAWEDLNFRPPAYQARALTN